MEKIVNGFVLVSHIDANLNEVFSEHQGMDMPADVAAALIHAVATAKYESINPMVQNFYRLCRKVELTDKNFESVVNILPDEVSSGEEYNHKQWLPEYAAQCVAWHFLNEMTIAKQVLAISISLHTFGYVTNEWRHIAIG